VRADDGGEIAHDQLEPIGQLAGGIAYAAAGHVLKAVSSADDYSKTCHPETWVNTQYPPRVTGFCGG
jgi:hypothetical protein